LDDYAEDTTYESLYPTELDEEYDDIPSTYASVRGGYTNNSDAVLNKAITIKWEGQEEKGFHKTDRLIN
jgi:hypothetical protein